MDSLDYGIVTPPSGIFSDLCDEIILEDPFSNFWVSPDSSTQGFFTIDFEVLLHFNAIKLKNAKNAHYNDRYVFLYLETNL